MDSFRLTPGVHTSISLSANRSFLTRETLLRTTQSAHRSLSILTSLSSDPATPLSYFTDKSTSQISGKDSLGFLWARSSSKTTLRKDLAMPSAIKYSKAPAFQGTIKDNDSDDDDDDDTDSDDDDDTDSNWWYW